MGQLVYLSTHTTFCDFRLLPVPPETHRRGAEGTLESPGPPATPCQTDPRCIIYHRFELSKTKKSIFYLHLSYIEVQIE